MGIEIHNNLIFNGNNILSNYNRKITSENIYEDENIKAQIDKSVHFQELQKRIIKHNRNNSAPQYLFDEKSRKIFYSALFSNNDEEEKEEEIENEDDLNIEKNKWKKELSISDKDININIIKPKAYDISERKITINDDDSETEFNLNYYKNGEELRKRYMTQLINKGVWMPNIEKKNYNSIIIFDWDDTLLPTTFLVSKGILNSVLILNKFEKKRLSELEELVNELLTLTVDKGDVYIITNADKNWIEYSSKLIYPRISNILKKIKIISAKNKYQKIYPGDSRIWKISAFLNLTKELDIKKITNIICSGDSSFEIEAGKILASKFTQAFIKTIKFKEKPELDEVFKQIMLVKMQFNAIHSAIKNLTIRVEKKKKEE